MVAWGIGLAAALLLLFSTDAMAAGEAAARVFAADVLPALFPVMVLCRLLPVKAYSPAGAILFAWVSGSPAAAQRVRLMYDAGAVNRATAASLLAATGVMSPMFFVGTLARQTGLHGAMWAMLLLHWLGALLTVGLWRLLAGHRNTDGKRAAASLCVQPMSLPRAVSESAQALLAVCGAMMLFSVAAGVLRALLARLLPRWVMQNGKTLSVVWALMEVGGGALAVIGEWKAPPLALLGGLCAFGGLSLWLQNLLFAGIMIRPAKLLCMRALHGALSFGLGMGVFALWPQLTAAFAGGAAATQTAVTVSPLVPLLLIGLCHPFRRSAL